MWWSSSVRRPRRTGALGHHGRRIEGYREHWGVEPDELLTRPVESCQAQEWDLAIETTRVLMPPPAPSLERGLDMGIDLGW